MSYKALILALTTFWIKRVKYTSKRRSLDFRLTSLAQKRLWHSHFLFHWYPSYMNDSTRSASSNQVAIPSFRTNLGRFCPSIIGSFFCNDIPRFIRDNHRGKCSEKHFYAGTLFNTNDTLSLLQLTELFCHFSFTFLLKTPSSLLYLTFKGGET